MYDYLNSTVQNGVSTAQTAGQLDEAATLKCTAVEGADVTRVYDKEDGGPCVRSSSPPERTAVDGSHADDVAVLKDRGKGARGRRGCALDADATRAGAGAAKERPTTAATAGSRLPEPAHIAIGRDPVSIQLSGSAFCACDCCPR
eukprot:gnl/TRDRNA2_/TRDRNA2_152026_c2_seq2.p2 gnl/TRDRNA2_/TRDRNA2_152026_c2~~gnl/TRDRNA2_/TRDRNA2_152026_c2_seq2.p2  ORF type:complete len:145 (+),score=24.42 gnl/TRDRNA2_/TRDRNA2_152026_c2_seq2:22-456(+)